MKNDLLGEVLNLFSDLLDHRFSQQNITTTEDSVRYTFFYCLTKIGDFHPSEIILEHPHPSIAGAEIDTVIRPLNSGSELVFEFKFDREIPCGKNSPRTQKAGRVFADILRLAQFHSEKDCQRYLVYVTDNEMAQYFENKKNQLNDFFNLPAQDTLRIDKPYINKHSKTFIKQVGNDIVPCKVRSVFRKRLQNTFELRVYEVKPL